MDDKGGGLVIYSVVHVASGDDYRWLGDILTG